MTQQESTVKEQRLGVEVGSLSLSIDTIIALATGMLGLWIYVLTLAPSILEGDSGEFQFTAPTLGVMHTTGYPLYTLLGWLWTHLLPFSGAAYKMNLFSAVVEAATLSLVYLMCLRLFRCALHNRELFIRLYAFLTAALLGTSFMFWSQAIVATVYSLHIFFVALTLWLMLRFRDTVQQNGTMDTKQATQTLLWFAAAYGFGLTHHRTMLLLAPGYLLFILLSWPGILRHVRLLGTMLLLALAPLLLYLYLPWRAAVDPRYPYLQHQLIAWIFGSDFAEQVAPSTWLSDLPLRLERLWAVTSAQFGVWGMALAAIGLGVLFYRQWRLALLLLGVALPTAAFAYLYRYGDPSAPIFNIGLYLLPVFLVIAICIGYCLVQCSGFVAKLNGKVGVVLALLLLLLLPGLQLRQNYSHVDMHANTSIEQYARTTMALPFAENSVIIGKWDTLTPLWYLQYIEGQRPDISIFDAPLLTQPWIDKITSSIAQGKSVYVFGNLNRMPATIESRLVAPAHGYTPRTDRDFTYAESDPIVELRQAQDTIQSPPGSPLVLGGELGLLGFSVAETPEAGKPVDISVFWQDEQSLHNNYRTVVRLKDAHGQVLAQSDKAPDDFWSVTYPTSHWIPGTAMRDVHQLTIPAGTAPLSYTVEAGVYLTGTNKWLEAQGKQSFTLGSITIQRGPAGAEPDAQTQLNPPLVAGDVAIAGYDYVPVESHPGAEVNFTLYWQAQSKPRGEYHIVAALQDSGGQQYSIQTLKPLDGQYPSSNWLPGELVRDPQLFAISAEVPNGTYDLVVTPEGPGGRGKPLRLGSVQVKGRERMMVAPSIQVMQQAGWQDGISLYGYSLNAQEVKPGGELQATLVWQATGHPTENYKIFFQMLDAQNKLVAQADAQPCQGSCPTTSWLAGEYLPDTYTLHLKPDLPPGDYTLIVGFYDESTGQRLLLKSGGDHIPLSLKIRVP